VSKETETTQISLDRDTALAFSAEALLDSYELAKKKKDIASMLKIAEMWVALSHVLDETDEPPKRVVGFSHEH
jgi:hypothetical protein